MCRGPAYQRDVGQLALPQRSSGATHNRAAAPALSLVQERDARMQEQSDTAADNVCKAACCVCYARFQMVPPTPNHRLTDEEKNSPTERWWLLIIGVWQFRTFQKSPEVIDQMNRPHRAIRPVRVFARRCKSRFQKGASRLKSCMACFARRDAPSCASASLATSPTLHTQTRLSPHVTLISAARGRGTRHACLQVLPVHVNS